jgi:hypothetical protein
MDGVHTAAVPFPHIPTKTFESAVHFDAGGIDQDDQLKDSGSRREFTTGAVRDASGPTKGAPHLRPIHALHRLDVHMAKGAKKYAARNWEKGIPLSVYVDSAQRHLDKLIAGYADEDHMAAALWNVACYLETEHRIRVGILPKDLNDMPDTFAALQPEF